MKYLNDRNIIHRDLKQGNILLDDNFHPLITDFGFSKIFEVGHAYSQTQFGDTKIDVYAFAFLMYEVITDSFAYPELHNGKMSDFEFKNKVVNENYHPKLDIIINDSLRQLIEDFWSSNPIDRPNFDSIVKRLCLKDYCLDDVDFDEFNIYVNDVNEVTDKIEKLLKKIEEIENENSKLLNENDIYKKKILCVEEENEKLMNDNIKLKEENNLNLLKIAAVEDEIKNSRKRNGLKVRRKKLKKMKMFWMLY